MKTMAKTNDVAAKTFKMMTMALSGAAPWQLDFTTVVERCDYLLTSGLWADCTFVVGQEIHQEVVSGHKLILAMASPVFEAMFYGALSEHHEIPIPDIQPEAFRALLAYIYTGDIEICSFNLAWELWYAGKKYQLPHLVDECKKYIESVVDPKNACRAYELARFFEEKSLMDLCIQEISTNAKEAIIDSSFDDVDLNTVITVRSLDPLNVDSELDLFNALARYAKAQERTQEQSNSTLVDVGVQVCFSGDGARPSEKLSISKESTTSEEKVVNGTENSAENTTVAVEVDSKSDDTEEEYEPKQKKINQEAKPNVRAALRKIRFLSLTPEEFADGPARSTLLSEAESLAILMNINSKVGEVPMPTGFSNCRLRRKQVVAPTTAYTGYPTRKRL